MQTIKFQPAYEKRQELFNVEDYSFTNFDFDGKERQVYNNANLSVFVDDYCNANCKFCVAQLRFENRGMQFKKRKIENDQEYFDRLDSVLSKIASLNPSISLTGGEPTKSNRLPEILRIINHHGLRKRTFTTNGSGLLDIYDGKTVIQYLIDNGFQHLNISKAHYNENLNKKIMNYISGYCSNDMLKTIFTISKANNLRPRMSCVLLRDGISNLDEMIKYMEFYQNLGLDNVIFRELMDFDIKTMTNKKKVKYCSSNKIRLNNIWNAISNDDRFKPIRSLIGYYYHVEIFKYQNIDMCSERANLVKLYTEKEKNKDIVYEMVFHPNGNLNGSWVDNEDVLIGYNNPNSLKD